MASPYNNVDSKLELAIKEVIEESSFWSTYSTDYDALTGINDGAYEQNGIVCFAESAEERLVGTGLWSVRMVVEIRSNVDAASSATTHRTLLANIRDLFMDDGITTTLDATDQTIRTSGVFGYRFTQGVEDRFLVGAVSFDVVASAF